MALTCQPGPLLDSSCEDSDALPREKSFPLVISKAIGKLVGGEIGLSGQVADRPG